MRDNGITFHTWMDNYNKDIVTPDPPKTTDQTKYLGMFQHATAWLDEFRVDQAWLHSELVVGADWVIGKADVFHEAKDRDYPHMPGYQFGTADIVAKSDSGVLTVADWKTGGTDGAEQQLLTLLTAFYLAYTAHGEAFTGYQSICLQVNERGCWPHSRSYTDNQLKAHASTMGFVWEDLDKPKEPVPGVHCVVNYCPHLAYCSAISGQVLDSASKDVEAGLNGPGVPSKGFMKNVTDDPKSSEEAGYTMAILAAAKRQIKYIESGVKNYVRSGGKALYDGYEWADGSTGFRWRKAK